MTLPQIDEQLWLISRVTQRVCTHMSRQNTFDNQLAVMAADPEIKAELHKIDQEFLVTELDGLNNL